MVTPDNKFPQTIFTPSLPLTFFVRIRIFVLFQCSVLHVVLLEMSLQRLYTQRGGTAH